MASLTSMFNEEHSMSAEKGLDAAVGICRIILSLLGVWPNMGKKRNWIFQIHFIIPAFVMFCFCNVPQTVKAIKVWGNLNEFLEVLTTSNIPIAISLLKMLGIWYNRNVLSHLLMYMAEDWKSSKTLKELQVMQKNMKLSRIISITIIVLAEGTIVAHFAMATFARVTESNTFGRKEANASERFRPLYVSSSFFYDVQATPYYEITWIFQSFSTFFAASAFSAADAFFAVLVMHLCGQLHILKENVRHLPERVEEAKKEGRSFVSVLAIIVKKHEYLNRFANTIEETFNGIFLVQIIISSIVLCFQGYQLIMITTEKENIPLFELTFMLYYTTCFIFSLFVYCYVAEILQTESLAIGHAAFESNWYDLPPMETRLLIIIMMRAKIPFQITAGKFVAFSLELFAKVLKSSGGYLSMLLAMKNRLTIPE